MKQKTGTSEKEGKVADESTISFADAVDACTCEWPDEAQARAQAAILENAGWRVAHRWPAIEFGQTGRMIVASVHHPVTYESPGDITYTHPTAAGGRAGVSPPPPTYGPGPSGPFVAVEGATGVGKTTLVRRLSDLIGARSFFDPFESNPFLSQLYSAGPREATGLALVTELTFLALRVVQLRNIQAHLSTGGSVLADWSPFKQEVFAATTLDRADWNRIARTCAIWFDGLPTPDVVVHLQAEAAVLRARIARRDRVMEQALTEAYLSELSTAFETALVRCGRAVLPVDTTVFDVFDDGAVEELAAQVHHAVADKEVGACPAPSR